MTFLERMLRVLIHVNIGATLATAAWIVWSGTQIVSGRLVRLPTPAPTPTVVDASASATAAPCGCGDAPTRNAESARRPDVYELRDDHDAHDAHGHAHGHHDARGEARI